MYLDGNMYQCKWSKEQKKKQKPYLDKYLSNFFA